MQPPKTARGVGVNREALSSYIPFVHSPRDCRLVEELYSGAPVIRVSLAGSEKMVKALPDGIDRWVDPGMDVFHNWPVQSPEAMERFEKLDSEAMMGDPEFQDKPKKRMVEKFSERLLDESLKMQPTWLSIPQLPYHREKRRGTMNRQLAAATRAWAVKRIFSGRLVLPVILTHQDQVNLKVERDRIIQQAKRCYDKGKANGIWVVDQSLNDQSGSAKLNQKRFPKLVEFHQELASVLPKGAEIIAGPYWGMNLVLWARGLATYPAIGVGSAYQYFLAGGVPRPGNARVAVAPLRRQAVVSSELEVWLGQATESFPKGNAVRSELENLRRRLAPLYEVENARRQVARFYQQWFDLIEAVPRAGRALALYQDLSSAFVSGRNINSALPRTEGTARRPERIAEQLMLSCL